MSENSVVQKALAGETTQIGVQNNHCENTYYNGLSPEKACELATDLFYNNFPKLQEQATDVVKRRVDELMKELVATIASRNNINISSFSDPDIQLSLLSAQSTYARFGGDDHRAVLTNLIANRLQSNEEDISLKVAIDDAIKIAGLLSQEQLDYLSVMFLLKQVKFGSVKSIADLEKMLATIQATFGDANRSSFSYLCSLDCFTISLGRATERLSKFYGFPITEIESISVPVMGEVHPDYELTHKGIILAIENAERKMSYKFDPSVWIHS